MISRHSAIATLSKGQPIYCYTHGGSRYRVVRIGRKYVDLINGKTLSISEIQSFDDGIYHGGMNIGRGMNQ
jgi:hypothetical protein